MKQRHLHDPYPYYLYSRSLKHLCAEQGFTLRTIGAVGAGKKEYSIYKVLINAVARSRATLCFAAGIHGYETSGPLAMLAFLENLDKKKLHGVKLVLLPLCNPRGFDYNRRRGFYGTDLNRGWDEKNPRQERKFLYNAVKNEKIDFFASFHDDDVEESFYFYAYHASGAEQPIHRVIRRAAKKFVPVSKKKKLYGLRVERGIIFNKHDSSFESRMHRDGVTDSVCIEAPDSLPLDRRVGFHRAIMESVTSFYARK